MEIRLKGGGYCLFYIHKITGVVHNDLVWMGLYDIVFLNSNALPFGNADLFFIGSIIIKNKHPINAVSKIYKPIITKDLLRMYTYREKCSQIRSFHKQFSLLVYFLQLIVIFIKDPDIIIIRYPGSSRLQDIVSLQIYRCPVGQKPIQENYGGKIFVKQQGP